MGDMGDLFNMHKKVRQAERVDLRESSPSALTAASIAFESKNMGAHLIVLSCGAHIDFWPGTGKWKSRAGKCGYGVANLIAFIRKSAAPVAPAKS